ncbi:MAG: helix-turn-helix transcriptional regulator [Actinocatenispora sp.]
MARPVSPVVQGWMLGVRLRQYRDQSGLTATEVGKRIGCSQAHISVIESGKPKLTQDRLTQLAELYDVGSTTAKELETLRREATSRAWWHEYSGFFSEQLQRFFGYEAGAEHVRGYHSELVHGLLQTEDYARAIIRGGSPHVRLTEVDRRVEARMIRQQLLTDSNPLHVTSILSESAIRQQIGGAATMRAQLRHLVSLAEEHPHVTLHVLPFSAGTHPSIGAPYQILSFTSGLLHDIVWQEILTSTDIVDQPNKVTEYVMTFHETARLALDEGESLDLITRVAGEL